MTVRTVSLSLCRTASFSCLCLLAAGMHFSAEAQVFRRLHAFAVVSPDGAAPDSLLRARDGRLYGTTAGGGAFNRGTVFRVEIAGTVTVLHSFDGIDGETPNGLVQAQDGRFYGTTRAGASGGAFFRIDGESGQLTVLHTFQKTDEGIFPNPGLIQAQDGSFYLTTASGGAFALYGTAVRLNTSGVVTLLHSFDGTDADQPGGLIQGSDGAFYGVGRAGGQDPLGDGTVFRMDADGKVTVLHEFKTTDGAAPNGPLTEGADGLFYGVTTSGAAGARGTVFKMDRSGVVTTLHTFPATGTEGTPGEGPLLVGPGSIVYGMTRGVGGTGAGALYRIDPGGSFALLRSFTSFSVDGATPVSLIFAADGGLLGATEAGGTANAGTLFALGTDNRYSVTYSFGYRDEGAAPQALAQTADGRLYGITRGGGDRNAGTVFTFDSAGGFQLLHALDGAEGASPTALAAGADGLLYGLAAEGGAGGRGVAFQADPGGSFATLHSFDASGREGADAVALVAGADGNLYGAAAHGGTGAGGTLFAFDGSGAFVVLHLFASDSPEGFVPTALIQGRDGNLYGATGSGGPKDGGTVFRMDTAGVLTVLHAFDRNGTEGSSPTALVQDASGMFYGTLGEGGPFGGGGLFRMDAAGTVLPLHSFATLGPEGSTPVALVRGGNGSFYGLNFSGGRALSGTLFQSTEAGAVTLQHSFNPSAPDGAGPSALLPGADGSLYGATLYGAPRPAAGSVNIARSAGMLFRFSPAVPDLKEVTDDLDTVRSGLTRDSDTRTYRGTITLTNATRRAISGPIQLILTRMSLDVALLNQEGVFREDPFLTVLTGLAPEESVTVPVEFNASFVSYTLKVYSGAL